MDVLKDYIYTMESCNSCGQCRFILGPKSRGRDFVELCPIYSRFLFESYSGQGLINIAQELLEGTLGYEEGLIEHIYSCMTCGGCDVNCKSVRDMEVLDTILALRAKCVDDGQGPMPAHKKSSQMIKQYHNPYGKTHSQRFDWLAENIEQGSRVDIAYFAGCTSAYLYPEIARNTVEILQAGDMPFKVLNAEEYCCGALLWRTGQVREAAGLVEHNVNVMKKRGIRTLILGCAECYGTFKGFYPRILDLPFQVIHISEVIKNMLETGSLKFNGQVPMKVTYHDPCLLGRLSEQYVPWEGKIQAFGYHDPPKKFRRGTHGVYDAPRDVLKAIPGIELLEMVRSAENAFCCGGGGGVPLAFPDLSLWTSGERLREADSTGAEAIVSCCPLCKTNFCRALDENNSALQYYDLTELVVRTIQ